MSKEFHSADLILKLYELRREEKMREARNWFIAFFPETIDDVMAAMIGAETSAKYRMVTSYWDMAASFVNRGAIDEEMFLDSGGECVIVFAKLQPFLDELRVRLGNPRGMKNLEDLLMRQTNALEMLAARREQMKGWMAAREKMAGSN